jgi:hypothetical protein
MNDSAPPQLPQTTNPFSKCAAISPASGLPCSLPSVERRERKCSSVAARRFCTSVQRRFIIVHFEGLSRQRASSPCRRPHQRRCGRRQSHRCTSGWSASFLTTPFAQPFLPGAGTCSSASFSAMRRLPVPPAAIVNTLSTTARSSGMITRTAWQGHFRSPRALTVHRSGPWASHTLAHDLVAVRAGARRRALARLLM